MNEYDEIEGIGIVERCEFCHKDFADCECSDYESAEFDDD